MTSFSVLSPHKFQNRGICMGNYHMLCTHICFGSCGMATSKSLDSAFVSQLKRLSHPKIRSEIPVFQKHSIRRMQYGLLIASNYILTNFVIFIVSHLSLFVTSHFGHNKKLPTKLFHVPQICQMKHMNMMRSSKLGFKYWRRHSVKYKSRHRL